MNYYKDIKFINDKEIYIWDKFWSNVENGNYNSLSSNESDIIRNIYKRDLDKKKISISKNEFKQIFIISDSELFLAKWDRIVIGDHGPYIEANYSDSRLQLIVKPGKEYRTKFKHAKYDWLCPIYNEDIKVYLQKGKVKYADYKVGKIYVSPYDGLIKSI